MTRSLAFSVCAVLALLAASCVQPLGPSGAPTPLPVSSPTPMPSAEILFVALPPDGTQNLDLILLDIVTGHNEVLQTVSMTRRDDGSFQARLIIPVGSVLHYQYIRREPSIAAEIDSFGEVIPYRMAYVPGPGQITDNIAAWSDGAYLGETGRILGHLRDAVSDEPLPFLMVSAAGMLTFSDSEGAFRLENLPIGIHQVVVVSPDGAYQPIQQGAAIATNRTTPVEFRLQPAPSVRLTLQVTVPSDTIPGVPVRVAGNVRHLGARFDLQQNASIHYATDMPTLFAVDNTHFVMLTEAHAGMDLRYKYTLGDGYWNAERHGDGSFLTRQVIVPDEDLTLVDTVSTWHTPEGGSLMFRLSVPENTPDSETIGVQFNRNGWVDPLEMWRLGRYEWLYTLNSPLDLDEPLQYRYCRNMQCGAAGTPADLGPEGIQGALTEASINQNMNDVVDAWRWWESTAPPASVVAPPIIPRPDLEVGVEFISAYDPSWNLVLPHAWEDILNFGSTAVTLSPAWVWEHSQPNPVLSFDPSIAPYPDELIEAIADAQQLNLSVGLRATTLPEGEAYATWWGDSLHSDDWWAVWFEEYRSFVLTLASQASQAGVSKLILGGPEVGPALPGGLLPNGLESDVPKNAETRWREIVDDVRAIYSGTLAFEIELGAELQMPPPFLDAFDEIHLYWHAPLTDAIDPEFDALQDQAASALQDVFAAHPIFSQKPLILVVEYLSLYASQTGCAPTVDESCRPASDFQHGAIADPDLVVNLEGQTEALNAVLLAAYARSEIGGFYVRGYDPTMPMQDKSASVNGKPARDLLWYWFPRITGSTNDINP